LRVSHGFLDDQVVTWDSHDWGADPFARGACSHLRIGGMEAQAALAPVRPLAATR
jgi:hypothetical protein